MTYEANIIKARRIFDEMGPAALGRLPSAIDAAAFHEFNDKGWINASAMAEDAFANAGGLTKDPTVGRDLSDGTDVKTSTAQTAGLRKSGEQRWKACIKNIGTKKDGLRIAIDLRKLPGISRNFVYAVVPYHVYENYTGDTLSIELDFRGRITGLFEKYEMLTQEEAANAKFYKGNVIRTSHPKYNDFI